jgi:hypothetical protein
MAELVEKAVAIDPSRCRQTAAERFAPDRVAAAYEALYREAIAPGVEAPDRDEQLDGVRVTAGRALRERANG